MIKYKVWYTKRGKIFDNFFDACIYAQRIHEKTGIIVAITEIKGRRRT